MVKKDYGEPTGKCSACTINLYGPDKKPAKMPCGIGGPERAKHRDAKERVTCPFENETQRLQLQKMVDGEMIAGYLGTMHGEQT